MEAVARSTIELNEKQIKVLEWVKQGCPDGVFPDDNYSHRVSAKALHSRGLLRVSGHGTNWRAEITERGRVWPDATKEEAVIRERWEMLDAAEVAERSSTGSKNRKSSTPRATRNPHRPATAPKAPSAAEKRRHFTHDLVRQLIAAGDTLTIPAVGWGYEESNWMERAAVSSPDRPHGKRSVSAALVTVRKPLRSCLSSRTSV